MVAMVRSSIRGLRPPLSRFGTLLRQADLRQRRTLVLGISFGLLVVSTLPAAVLAGPDVNGASPTNATAVEAPEHAVTPTPGHQSALTMDTPETPPEHNEPNSGQEGSGSSNNQPAESDTRAEQSSTATPTSPSTTTASDGPDATRPNAGITTTTTVSATGNMTGAAVSTGVAVQLDVIDPFAVPHPEDRQRSHRVETGRSDSTPAPGNMSERLQARAPTSTRGFDRPEASDSRPARSSGSRSLGLGSSAPVSLPEVLGLGGLVGAGAVIIASRRFTAGAESLLLRKTLGTSLPRLLADWLGRLGPVIGLAGYQRYADDDPLDHPTRATIFERIQANPGIYLSALAEATETPLGTVRHHLKILEFEGLVTRTDNNGRRRYSPIDVDPDVIETLLDESAAQAVLAALADGPASVGELAARVDRDPSTITHHTTRLAEISLVERERDGRTTRNRLTDEGRAAMRRARAQAQPADEAASPFGTPTD